MDATELALERGPEGVPDEAVGDRPLPPRRRRSAVSFMMRVKASSGDSPGSMQSLPPSSSRSRPPREDPGDLLRSGESAPWTVDGARLRCDRGVSIRGVGGAESPMKNCSGTCLWLSALPFAIGRPEQEEADPLAGGLRVPAFPLFDELDRTDLEDDAGLDLPKCGKLEVLGVVCLELDKLP